MRALRTEDLAGTSRLHTLRKDASARMDSVDEFGGVTPGGGGQRRSRLDGTAAACGGASTRVFLPRVVVDGSRGRTLRLDAAGRGPAGLGILCMEKSSQGQAGDQDAELAEPETLVVCISRGFCADFAVVDSGGAAFGENHGAACTLSGFALRHFLGGDLDCCDSALLQGGDAEFAARKWQDAVAGEPGRAGHVCGVYAGRLVADLVGRASGRPDPGFPERLPGSLCFTAVADESILG